MSMYRIQARLLMGLTWCGLSAVVLWLFALVNEDSVLFILSAFATVAATACLLWLGSVHARLRLTKKNWFVLELLLTSLATVASILGLLGYSFEIATESYAYDDWSSMSTGIGLVLFCVSFALVQWRILWIVRLQSIMGKCVRWAAFIAAWILVHWIVWEGVYFHGPWSVNETLAGVLLTSGVLMGLVIVALHLHRHGMHIKRGFAYAAIFCAFALFLCIWSVDLLAYFLDTTIEDFVSNFDESSVVGMFGVLALTAAVGLIALWESLMRKIEQRSLIQHRPLVQVQCPRCELVQNVQSAQQGRCDGCGLRIHVEIDEARCECGYLLFQPPEKACPECGRLVAHPKASAVGLPASPV